MVLFVLFNFRNLLRLWRKHILDRGSKGPSLSRAGNAKYSDAEQPRHGTGGKTQAMKVQCGLLPISE